MAEFTREKRFKTRSVAGTLAIASTLAEMFSAPRIVLLTGDLGAGKTTLVKGWAEALRAAKAEDVTSPTFTLIHPYKGPRTTLYHLDVYRLEHEHELAALGIDEIAGEPDAVVVIEWGARFPGLVAMADGEVHIEELSGCERGLHVRWRDRSCQPA